MRRTEGAVTVSGSVSYAPQNPWYVCFTITVAWVYFIYGFIRRILSASVRDNILFSHEYDENFYNLVLDGVYFSHFLRADNQPLYMQLALFDRI
jgi:ATP-binding cassette, subfamily C (CFTR/MRP), member 1